jgi:hypothetical protein
MSLVAVEITPIAQAMAKLAAAVNELEDINQRLLKKVGEDKDLLEQRNQIIDRAAVLLKNACPRFSEAERKAYGKDFGELTQEWFRNQSHWFRDAGI